MWFSIPGFNNLLNENNYILGLEIFKIYYHPDLVLNKNQFTEIDELAKKYTIFTPYCVNALILIIKTSSSIIVEMDRLARELPEYREKKL